MSDFNESFRKVIGYEGGYVNDPDDPGGETQWGISKASYPELDIKGLSPDDAKAIYRRDYWQAMKLEWIADSKLATEVFEQAVNLGRKAAAINLQTALRMLGASIAIDGVVGQETLKTANQCKWTEELVKVLNCLQFDYYKEIVSVNPKLKKYWRGWLRRVEV